MAHTQLPDDKYHIIDQQKVEIAGIDSTGFILDIGGGGEGVIGRLAGDRVVAIDINREELEESPPGPFKIVMDAAELYFRDQAFGTVTSFLSFMYMPMDKRGEAFRECCRVLRPSGDLLIWDLVIPFPPANAEDIFVAPVEIVLPDDKISTAYGVPWVGRRQNPAYYLKLADETGLEIISLWQHDAIFFMHLCRN